MEHAAERADTALDFTHERIDDHPPCSKLNSLQTTDLTGNGSPDVIVVGMGGEPTVPIAGTAVQLPMAGPASRLALRFETNVFWYENPGWERHALATEFNLHPGVGSDLADISGNGRLDFVVGQGFGKSDLYWYEQPADPREPWRQHHITDAFEKYHDLLVADVDDDGEPELVGLSQDAESVFYYDVPADPFREPWPVANCHVLDDDRRCEGLAAADVDGDGRTEIVAGTNVYHRHEDGWARDDICTGWDDTRVAVADLDGDGEPEIVLSEGDSPTFGTHPGRLAWVDYPDGEPEILRDGLFNPHSLQTADVTGNGYPDIYVGEMSLGEAEAPEQLLFENHGDGRFTEHVVERGVPTHEAKLADMTGDGGLDIVGKSYGPDHHVDVWYRD
ncbi:FG-GAP repeat domain-containing protein [Haloarcula sediminis]|uniref:FG-GAP repeat domain-containing protein n=1 Tax=Haloarcula sediminis TaxID=3111777 RepID=UPI002D782295|nr:VCBS repeat-containing protein [Haloarcula sp. CK38]